MDRASRGELVALLLAAGAHALLLAAPWIDASLGRAPALAVARPVTIDAIDVETIVEPPPNEPRAPQDADADDARAEVTPPRAEGRVAAVRVPHEGTREAAAEAPANAGAREGSAPERTAPGEPNAPAEPTRPGPSDEYGGVAPAAPDALSALPGVGSRPAWTVPGAIPAPDRPAPAPTAPAPAASAPKDIASRVLTGTMNKRDQELGVDLPAAGVVADALSDAVRATTTELEARATFEVRLGPKGQLLGVNVKSFSSGNAGNWNLAAKTAAAAIAKRGLAVDESAPVTVIVKVEASQKYAAGSDKRLDVKPVCANEVIEQIADALKDPAARMAPPPPDDGRPKPCIPIGLKGTLDPANLGSRLQTNVHASYKIVRDGDVAMPSDAAMPLEDRAFWLPQRADHAERPEPPWKHPKKKKKKPNDR